MTEPVITMIYAHNVPQIWSNIEPILEPALSISETHTIEDIYKSIMSSKSQLWVQWSGKVDAAVVTEFIDYPRGLWFRFWLAGAVKDAEVLWKNFFDVLYNFAKKSGCVGIEDCGRDGWNHYAPQAKKVTTLRRIKIGESHG